MSDKTASVLSVVAVVAYDGTDYHGFQYQVEQPTIQGALEDVLGTFSQYQGRVIGSGRTDTGVHTEGQVILPKFVGGTILATYNVPGTLIYHRRSESRQLIERLKVFILDLVHGQGHIVTWFINRFHKLRIFDFVVRH